VSHGGMFHYLFSSVIFHYFCALNFKKMIIDKLFQKVADNGHVCVGLDTDYTYLPADFAAKFHTIHEGLFEYNKQIIDATKDIAACYKVQLAYLRSIGAVIIADVKRGDIAKTAEMYAKAHFTGDFECDFMTINPYMGMDSIAPYLPYVKEHEKGLFVLIRTSNEGAKDIEYLPTGERHVYNVVGEKLNTLGKECLGQCGFSSIGGVMGCTHSSEAAEVRAALDSTFFLIPGYGAQGGKASDIACYLKNGNGGVVNASRSILLAYRKVEGGESHFAECSRNEAIRMRDDILAACK